MAELAALIAEWDELAAALDVDVRRSVLRPGATEEEILALEARLGVSLPRSYRAFLAASNGADVIPGFWHPVDGVADGPPAGMLATEDVEWAIRKERDLVNTWALSQLGPDAAAGGEFQASMAEREYLDYESNPDVIDIKAGHLRYALAVSHVIDGYAIFLNPLVVDADGEWEAWDFGTKLPGANRYRSFLALVEAANAQARRALARDAAGAEASSVRDGVITPAQPATDEEVSAAVERATDRLTGVPFFEAFKTRSEALDALARLPNRRAREALVSIADDTTEHEWIRQAAANALATSVPDEEIGVLVHLASSDALRIRAAALARLAASTDTDARHAAHDLLVDPRTDGPALHSLRPDARDAVREAWRETHSPRLLVAWTLLFDPRCIEPLAEEIRTGELPADDYDSNVIQAAWRFSDPRIVAALVDAASRPGAPLLTIARTLHAQGADREALPVLARIAPEDDAMGMAAGILAAIDLPGAAPLLLEHVRRHPTSAAISGLARWPSDAALDAIASLLGVEPDGVVVGALEMLGTRQAADVLIPQAEAGNVVAIRALARMRDERVLGPLLARLGDRDDGVALVGAEGLRDLRATEATEALLTATKRFDPDLAVVSAHALICMRSPAASEGVRNVASSPDETARRVAQRWLEVAGWS